jgi:TolB-like protein
VGVEVWFDQSELRGGDAWDRQIRARIHDCRLFIAVISAGTEARDEGYFRREWKLAVDRTHDMSERKTFLLPVVIDRTSERGAAVPEKFREVQWTRLPDGETPPEFAARVARLMAVEPPTQMAAAGSPAPGQPAAGRGPAPHPRALPLAALALVVAGLGYFFIDKVVRHAAAPPAPSPAAAAPAAAPAAPAFNPPPHSIAVLPFANLSGDPGQDYFSDGLTEELLNSLAAVEGLQVAARTSSFSFKGKDTDIGTIARKLDVGAVLEGSVRRSGHTVRITAQLINAVTGFHLWSKTYDRDLGDVLKLQTEIATAVANALKVTLLADTAARIEVGGTRNPAALDAYLRATRLAAAASEAHQYGPALAAYTEAIRLDPNYAAAIAGRSFVESLYAGQGAVGPAIREHFDNALADARRAIALAPELASAHSALGFYLWNGAFDLRGASAEFERARALAPGNAAILQIYGLYAISMGNFPNGIADLRRAAELDPLNVASYYLLGRGLYWSHRYAEALPALDEASALDPEFLATSEYRGLSYIGLGEFDKARAACEPRPDYWGAQWCLAIAYQKLGRHADAQAALTKLQGMQGDAASYQYATIYAQRGDVARALQWLETALRVRDPGVTLIRTDPFLDPLRKEPRFQAVERQLKFPD